MSYLQPKALNYNSSFFPDCMDQAEGLDTGLNGVNVKYKSHNDVVIETPVKEHVGGMTLKISTPTERNTLPIYIPFLCVIK